MKDGKSLSILMPTCSRYAAMAEWSVKQIDACWSDHPPLTLCGVRSLAGLRCLPFSSDERDWTGIALEATDHLIAEGGRWCYLILDDHPPFGFCNADFLNRMLPEVAESLQAGCISLSPWDGLHETSGEILPADCLQLRRFPGTDKWRYSLHPSLWRLDFLNSLLRRVHEDPGGKTARGFEAVSGRLETDCNRTASSCYRVVGRPFACTSGPLDARWRRQLFHLRRFLHGMHSSKALARFDTTHEYLVRFHNGPYPLFWSGLMHGGLHEEAIRFLEYRGCHREASEAIEAAGRVLSVNTKS